MTINCLNCNSQNTIVFFEAKEIGMSDCKYLKCRNCSLVFLNIPNSKLSKLKKYSDEYYGLDDVEKFKNKIVLKIISISSRLRANRIAKYLNQRDRIIDLGCGNGRFLEQLHRTNLKFELHGVEVNPKAALRATKRLNGKAWVHTILDLEKFFGKESFNAICMIHVLEHIDNPKVLLDEFEKVVRKDGKILIVVPNVRSWQFSLFGTKWFHLDFPRHTNFFDKKLLNAELKNRNFKLVYSKNFDFEQGPFGFIQSFLNLLFKDANYLYESFKTNKTKTHTNTNAKILVHLIIAVIVFPIALIFELTASIFKKGAILELLYTKTE